MKIDIKIKEKVRSYWLLASKNLNFEIVTPFTVTINNKKREVFAYLPKYGSKNGMIIELIGPPEYATDKEVIIWARQKGYFSSFMNIEDFKVYNESNYIDALRDWTISYVKPIDDNSQ